ncbi:MAG: stage II sporulation protein R [Desulforudis sp.]|jgi:stage II sporulation protein R|nr:stage II sporulation protein R [Clostridia bacterium]MDQ7791447.1 stage II sporulation protein R [Clostridia bacterium]RJX16755.1 MAG: stage II sporulation protein R [Desulforudis sp.]
MISKRLLYAGVTVIGLAIIGSGLFGWQARAVEAYNRDNLIRLHVIPNSDSEADQALKQQVRDAVTETLRPKLGELKNVDEAREFVLENLDLIQETAASGHAYPVQVVFGTFDFPVREYGSLVLPEGKYQAVRIVLGDGDGANWWCVLFPPLCFVYSGEGSREEAVVAWQKDGPVHLEMKFRAVELWERLRS